MMFKCSKGTGTKDARGTLLYECFRSYNCWKHLLLVGLCFLIIFIRLPSLYMGGNFIGEDGWVFFAGAFNGAFPISLFQPYAGYFHLLPRLIAEICMLFGYGGQPYLYATLSTLIVSYILTLFYAPGFRLLLPSDLGRMLVVILLALCHNSENLGLLLGIHWYLAFAVVLICCVPLPISDGGKITFFLLSFFAAWSSPSVMAVGPFLLWRIWRPLNPLHRYWSWFTLFNIATVFLFVLWMRLDSETRTGEYQIREVFITVEHVFIRGWLAGTFIGEGFSASIGGLCSGILDVLGFCVFSGVIWMFLSSRKYAYTDRKPWIVFGMMFLSATFMIAMSFTRSLYIEETAMSILPRHTRYLSAPSLLLIIAFWSILWKKMRTRNLWFWVWSVQFSLLLLTIHSAKHWAREFIYFPWREQVTAIERFARQDPGKSDSLYIPSDVPYWGPVLLKNGGYQHRPEDGFSQIRGISDSSSTKYMTAWFGSFYVLDEERMIMHQALGVVEYRGEFEGRVWFRNKDDGLFFTSPLMGSQYWKIQDGVFTLLTSFPLSQ